MNEQQQFRYLNSTYFSLMVDMLYNAIVRKVISLNDLQDAIEIIEEKLRSKNEN